MSIKIKNQELKEKLLNVSGVEVPPIVEKSSYVRSKTEYARMVGAQGVLDFWQKMYEDGTVIIPQELERGTPLYDEIDTLYQKKGGVDNRTPIM